MDEPKPGVVSPDAAAAGGALDSLLSAGFEGRTSLRTTGDDRWGGIDRCGAENEEDGPATGSSVAEGSAAGAVAAAELDQLSAAVEDALPSAETTPGLTEDLGSLTASVTGAFLTAANISRERRADDSGLPVVGAEVVLSPHSRDRKPQTPSAPDLGFETTPASLGSPLRPRPLTTTSACRQPQGLTLNPLPVSRPSHSAGTQYQTASHRANRPPTDSPLHAAPRASVVAAPARPPSS